MGILHDLSASGLTVKEIQESIGRGAENLSTGPVDVGRHSVFVLVKVTTAASGGGKYNGRIVTSSGETQVSATGTLAEADLGVIPTADNCLVLNSAEVAKSTHDLTTGTPVAKVFLGKLKGRRSAEGLRVVVINGLDWENCT